MVEDITVVVAVAVYEVTEVEVVVVEDIKQLVGVVV
jgi:hypothetical protein